MPKGFSRSIAGHCASRAMPHTPRPAPFGKHCATPAPFALQTHLTRQCCVDILGLCQHRRTASTAQYPGSPCYVASSTPALPSWSILSLAPASKRHCLIAVAKQRGPKEQRCEADVCLVRVSTSFQQSLRNAPMALICCRLQRWS